MKNVAIIISTPPHGNAKGREALDTALALSTFNHISVFFMGDGIFHLLPNQHPEEILMRDYIATFNMLELYDIEDVYVCKTALDERNLSQIALNIPNQQIEITQFHQLLADQDTILRF
ncbi:sulfurtransferase complex subunit TusC [Gilliamella sp. B2889]|uniref:sulfurtransferase complex subunit TusC n=1 Tax=Gilliamella sp. B2889 TaxID=2817985 RepID=UPI002269BC9A|nr:sulfurtransferase complex subunit TusC [Gilliamella sp. B2889]MCX8683855.1 sulfurtransferase complex subunit TusC [Gilliamella sp. B2889]